LKAWPSAEKSPVSETDAPIVIGALVAAAEELELGLAPGLPLLLQAASMAVAAAAAPRDKNRVR
jgi:hypothetical protein